MTLKKAGLTLTFDGNRIPKKPKKSVVARHNSSGGKVSLNTNDFKFISTGSKLKQEESFIGLRELSRRFQQNTKRIPCDANFLDAINGRFDCFPEKLKKPGTYLIFLGTTYVGPKNQLCVRAVTYAKGWEETVLLAYDRFSENDFVVTL